LEVHEIIADLEIYADEGDITTVQASQQGQEDRKTTYTSMLVVVQAIINSIPMRRSPPISGKRRIRAGKAIQDGAGHTVVCY
jgi:hypothetical protein